MFCMPFVVEVGSPQVGHQANSVALSTFHVVPMHQTGVLSQIVEFEVGDLRLLGYKPILSLTGAPHVLHVMYI